MSLAIALIVILQPLASVTQDPFRAYDSLVHEATKRFSYDQFYVVPVRVHVFQSKKHPALDSKLVQRDVDQIFWKVNRIWNRAGIAIMIESTVYEKPEGPDNFVGARASFEIYKSMRPKKSIADGVLHVYYVHELQANGTYQAPNLIFVQGMASFRKVPGGADTPLPRVTSHEIGHAMGLAHRQEEINLMASGTSGWSVNDGEIEKARTWAKKTKWTLTPEQVFGLRRYKFLSELPGTSDVKKRAKEALKRKSSKDKPKIE